MEHWRDGCGRGDGRKRDEMIEAPALEGQPGLIFIQGKSMNIERWMKR